MSTDFCLGMLPSAEAGRYTALPGTSKDKSPQFWHWRLVSRWIKWWDVTDLNRGPKDYEPIGRNLIHSKLYQDFLLVSSLLTWQVHHKSILIYWL